MEVQSDRNKCRCKHCCCYLKAKYNDFNNHTASKHIAGLSSKNITYLIKILACTESSAASKVVFKLLLCSCKF